MWRKLSDEVAQDNIKVKIKYGVGYEQNTFHSFVSRHLCVLLWRSSNGHQSSLFDWYQIYDLGVLHTMRHILLTMNLFFFFKWMTIVCLVQITHSNVANVHVTKSDHECKRLKRMVRKRQTRYFVSRKCLSVDWCWWETLYNFSGDSILCLLWRSENSKQTIWFLYVCMDRWCCRSSPKINQPTVNFQWHDPHTPITMPV